jgi:sugar-specific transcriptional regulator TrmB
MDMELRVALKKVGFTSNEADVYLAALRIGSNTAGRLSKEAQVDRSATYDAVKRLLEKGMMSYTVIGGRKHLQAVDPKRLLEYLKEKEEVIEETMPRLSAIYMEPKEKKNVTLYHGSRGLKTVFNDILREGKPNDIFGSEGQFEERMPGFCDYFIKERDRKKIPTRMIIRKGRTNPSNSKSVRFLDVERSPAVTNIYGNKIAIVVWSEPPEAVVIENKDAAESYRSYFEVLWRSAGKERK